MKQVRFILFLSIFSLIVSHSGYAQHIVDNTVINLDTVTVTANRFINDVIPAQVLSGKELQRLSVVSVADAI